MAVDATGTPLSAGREQAVVREARRASFLPGAFVSSASEIGARHVLRRARR